MRPTITEQLEGVARILRDVVAPHVDDPNASEQLGHALNVVRSVAAGWATYGARLREDGVDLAGVLRSSGLPIPPPPPDPLDLDALETWHEELRGRLADLIRHRAATGASTDDLRAQLLRSTARFA